MGFAPRPNPLHFLGAAPVILIGRFSPPAGLAQCLAGLLAVGLRTESLVVATARIGQEQLLTTQASAASALALHKARRDVPERTRRYKKTRKKIRRPRRRTAKKEESIGSEVIEENRGRRWRPFKGPALAPFQNAAGRPPYRTE